MSTPSLGSPSEDWASELVQGRPEPAWDLFLGRYRRLIFAAIRHYARDYDDVMDVFARVCDTLREDNMKRLRIHLEEPEHRARFSTWLVAVVRHVTVDWFRLRDGRRRLPAVAERLPRLQRRIFQLVFLDGRSHTAAYETIRTAEAASLTFHEFQTELRATYRAVAEGRRGHLLRDLGAPPPPEELGPWAAPGDGETLEEIVGELLGSLSPEDKVTVQLYVLDELPADDVARVVGLPNAKAVYNRVYRALASLRERLHEAGIRREDLL